MKTAGQVWLSLEQAAQLLEVPWFIVWRWARDGDARLPAYRIWHEGYPRLGSFRFQQQDVTALQARDSAPPHHEPR
jgi:hypothetical protein